jgi:predicted alpha/beta hydrolase
MISINARDVTTANGQLIRATLFQPEQRATAGVLIVPAMGVAQRYAPKNMIRIAPADVGARRIGHFGFFRSSCEQALWQKYLLPELS